MVELTKWGRINQSKFWDFVGLSLFNLSIGISVGIARADNFILSNNSGQLAVAKAAILLNSKAEELENITNSIKPDKEREKQNLKQINGNIIETKESLNTIVEDNL
jgi:hypothetical protein